MPKIVYLDTLPAQNGLEILHSQSKVEIIKISSSDNEDRCFSILKDAHAYQVGAARDEVPEHLQVDRKFLRNIQNLKKLSAREIVKLNIEVKKGNKVKKFSESGIF